MTDKATQPLPELLLPTFTDEALRQELIRRGFYGFLLKLPKGMKLEFVEGIEMREVKDEH